MFPQGRVSFQAKFGPKTSFIIHDLYLFEFDRLKAPTWIFMKLQLCSLHRKWCSIDRSPIHRIPPSKSSSRNLMICFKPDSRSDGSNTKVAHWGSREHFNRTCASRRARDVTLSAATFSELHLDSSSDRASSSSVSNGRISLLMKMFKQSRICNSLMQ